MASLHNAEFLHTQDCHVWKEALAVLIETLESHETNLLVRVVRVDNNKQAKTHRFSGSPQVNINGKDVDPMAGKITQTSHCACRPYFWEGKTYEFPPKEMIEKALEEASA